MITRRMMHSFWPGGDGSTLSLDFTTGVLDPRLTFTRSSTGTFINAIGLVATASNNVARFDHDPTTLAPRGLLIEGSANNLCLRSEDFADAVWKVDNNGATNPDVYTVSQTAPNGASSVNRVTLNKTGGTFSRLYQAITGTAGQTYTLSVWMKANTANGGAATQNVGLRIGGSTGVNCVVTTTWQRFTHPAFAITGTDANFQLLLWDNVPANDETADVLVWGAQVELGSGASSYIPTGASQGSRAADECSMTGTNFSSWFNATEGAFLAHARRMRTTDVGRIASANDNTANESFDIGASTTGQFIVTDGGSALATITPGTVTANTAFKIAGAFKLNDVQAALGGTLGTPDTGVTMPTVNQLMIGRQAGGSPVYLNGTVSLLKFWPTRLPDAQLQSLTT